jgi:hypothetical protein
MDTPPWRERVRAEEETLQRLQDESVQAAKRRAAALADGVAELGSMYAVAKMLGRSETAVAKAIKKHPPTTT